VNRSGVQQIKLFVGQAVSMCPAPTTQMPAVSLKLLGQFFGTACHILLWFRTCLWLRRSLRFVSVFLDLSPLQLSNLY